MQTQLYDRKPFTVEGVQITEDNMEAVAAWCGGSIQKTDSGERYIKVHVKNAQTPRQSQGFLRDWVLKATNGFRVYTNKAFPHAFIPHVELTN